MKNSNKANRIVNIIRAIVVLFVFCSPNIVSAMNMEVPTVSYGPVTELAWEYDSFVELTWQKCSEVIDDIEDWSMAQDEELRNSSCEPVRVLGEYSQKCRKSAISAGHDVTLAFTRALVDQYHAFTETWFSKG